MEAAELAQHYADLWQATVNLNLVPRFRIASAMWRDDEEGKLLQCPS
jgi:hypothetical protein